MGKQPQSEYFSIPLVSEHYAQARLVAQQEAGDLFDVLVKKEIAGDTPLESPLEAVFYAWFKAYTTVRLNHLSLRPQVEVEHEGQRYRVDFEVTARGGFFGGIDRQKLWRSIAVEVDGHTFHEKTLEQVTYRNQRDRALQQLGWKVFHFSFEEFTKSPERSVLEVVNFAHKQSLELASKAFDIEHPDIDLSK